MKFDGKDVGYLFLLVVMAFIVVFVEIDRNYYRKKAMDYCVSHVEDELTQYKIKAGEVECPNCGKLHDKTWN